ncbi:MAG: hypothetical protein CSA07_02375 [Bacteroidia bacterium]|nr:MAG: hypothetical protein CSA07_02375 [Bacteroidia bacterium]
MLAAGDTVWNAHDASGARHGFWRAFYDNGRLKYRGEFSHGRAVGRTTRYAATGELKSVMDYEPDGHACRVVIYDALGRVQGRGAYYDKHKDGKWQYFSGPMLVREEGWHRGKKHGKFVEYQDNGHMGSVGSWRNGEMDGPQEQYYGNGALRMRWEMKRGLEQGPSVTYYPSGAVRLRGQFRDGKRDGVWRFYTLRGEVERELEYRKGALVRGDRGEQLDSVLRALMDNKGKIPEPMPGGERAVPRNGREGRF